MKIYEQYGHVGPTCGRYYLTPSLYFPFGLWPSDKLRVLTHYDLNTYVHLIIMCQAAIDGEERKR